MLHGHGIFPLNILNDNVAQHPCFPIDNDLYISPKYGLGKLDRLPLELEHAILAETDLQTLANLRTINRQAKAVVDSLPQYQKILKHSPVSLRAIFSIELQAHITCRALFDALHTENCECCGLATDYIYLLAYRRVCRACLVWDDAYLPITPEQASAMFEVPTSVLQDLPTMKSITGRYAFGVPPYSHRFTFVDPSMASLAASAFWAGQGLSHSRAAKPLDMRSYRGGKIYLNEDDARFMAVVLAPCIQR